MLYIFKIILILFSTSCTSSKDSYQYFTNCEKYNDSFNEIVTCGFKNIQTECKKNKECKLLDSRLSKNLNNLNNMVQNNEISENEAMFRYLQIIETTEIKKDLIKKMHFRNFNHYKINYLNPLDCVGSYSSLCYYNELY